MPFTLKMPKLSPTMEEGTLIQWHVKEGEYIEEGKLLIEVATDKATIEHHAIDEGWLRKILVSDGEVAQVNKNLAIFTEEEKESFEEIMLKEKQALSETESLTGDEDKGPVDSGTLDTTQATSNSVGGLKEPVFKPYPPLKQNVFPYKREAGGRIKASPLAKKLAKEKQLDISALKGSGPQGRVLAEDLKYAQPNTAVHFNSLETPSHLPGSYHEEAVTPMKKAIGKRLQESKTFIPHFYVRQEIQVDALMATRNQLKNLGVKVSFNDLVTKASALALREHPVINSGFNTETQSITCYETIDIAIAVSLDEGLITPIIRHCDYKSVGEISLEIKDLAAKAKQGTLQPEEYQGGSFTISNLGMFGISDFQAVINPPQGAILAVSGIEAKPVIHNDKLAIGHTMNMTLSLDHRVIDGVAAAKYIKTVHNFLENPASLLL